MHETHKNVRITPLGHFLLTPHSLDEELDASSQSLELPPSKMTMSITPSVARLLVGSLLFNSLVVHVDSQGSMCGPAGFSIAGSSSVLPIALAWRDAYVSMCPGLDITVEGGGSAEGAARVCANVDGNSSGVVQVGEMSREFDSNEAVARGAKQDYVYDCTAGDKSLSVIQVEVALDGISVVASGGGIAASCMEKLEGLTIDQLRWIFSSYSDEELQNTGWDPSSLGNSDDNEATRNWSELDASCDEVPIIISGSSSTSGTYEYFAETIFADIANGETFALNRNYTGDDDPEVSVALIEKSSEAVAFFGYSFYYANGINLYASAIQNDAGQYVTPGADTVSDGSYNPLSRRLYMNLLNDEDSLTNTAPYVYFGFSPDGSDIVSTTGYVPVPNPSEMLARLSEQTEVVANADGDGNNDATSASLRTRTWMATASALAFGVSGLLTML